MRSCGPSVSRVRQKLYLDPLFGQCLLGDFRKGELALVADRQMIGRYLTVGHDVNLG